MPHWGKFECNAIMGMVSASRQACSIGMSPNCGCGLVLIGSLVCTASRLPIISMQMTLSKAGDHLGGQERLSVLENKQYQPS